MLKDVILQSKRKTPNSNKCYEKNKLYFIINTTTNIILSLVKSIKAKHFNTKIINPGYLNLGIHINLLILLLPLLLLKYYLDFMLKDLFSKEIYFLLLRPRI